MGSKKLIIVLVSSLLCIIHWVEVLLLNTLSRERLVGFAEQFAW